MLWRALLWHHGLCMMLALELQLSIQPSPLWCPALLSCGRGPGAGRVSSHTRGAGSSSSCSQWERQRTEHRGKSSWLPGACGCRVFLPLTLLSSHRPGGPGMGGQRLKWQLGKPEALSALPGVDKGQVVVSVPPGAQSPARCWGVRYGAGECWPAAAQGGWVALGSALGLAAASSPSTPGAGLLEPLPRAG